MKRAIIVGHTGQDGTYLYNLLKEKKYSLIGISGSSVSSEGSLAFNKVDICNPKQVSPVIKNFLPDEIYFLAAVHQSSADKEIEDGELFQKSCDVNVKAYINFLESVRLNSPKTKIFYAASSHIFGSPANFPQDENTPINPNCVYGITKTAGFHASHFYRESHSIFASVGIFYNHESPLRESKYVSKKIVETAVAIKKNKKSELELGNIESQIDWGYAPDYMEAAYQMMQINHPDDFVISSGELHSIKNFVEAVFTYLELDWKKYIKINPLLITKKQKKNLFGNNNKICEVAGWKPKVNFNSMVKILVDEELKKYVGK
ncbi:MAG: GDP-mannose 4,6-dehydratase [Bacteroidetes bacterium]|nr:GDP-mannose 4,6-dehydratase [Bacteroidota bacterium]